MQRLANLLLLVALSSIVVACATDHALVLKNNTSVPLTYCPVEVTPPPPHREVSSTVLQPPLRFPIDVEGFNPLFWDPVSNLSVTVQIALADDPPMILAVVYQHVVPPGQEGSDPALQPIKQAEYSFEVDPDDEKMKVVVRAGAISAGMPIMIVED